MAMKQVGLVLAPCAVRRSSRWKGSSRFPVMSQVASGQSLNVTLAMRPGEKWLFGRAYMLAPPRTRWMCCSSTADYPRGPIGWQSSSNSVMFGVEVLW